MQALGSHVARDVQSSRLALHVDLDLEPVTVRVSSDFGKTTSQYTVSNIVDIVDLKIIQPQVNIPNMNEDIAFIENMTDIADIVDVKVIKSFNL